MGKPCGKEYGRGIETIFPDTGKTTDSPEEKLRLCVLCHAAVKAADTRIDLLGRPGLSLCMDCRKDYALLNVNKRELLEFTYDRLDRLPRRELLRLALRVSDEAEFLKWYYSGAFIETSGELL
jgi:hypothetical protein